MNGKRTLTLIILAVALFSAVAPRLACCMPEQAMTMACCAPAADAAIIDGSCCRCAAETSRDLAITPVLRQSKPIELPVALATASHRFVEARFQPSGYPQYGDIEQRRPVKIYLLNRSLLI